MKKKKKKDDLLEPSNIVVKTSLKSIIRHKEATAIIEDAVDRTSRIVIHAYQFLKAYLCKKINDDDPFPTIDKHLIMNVMKTVSDPGRKVSSIADYDVHEFYEKYYKDTSNGKKPSYTMLTQSLDYESVKIMTGIKNHISTNFEQMLNRYINVLVNKERLIEETDDRKQVLRELTMIKNDILYSRNDSDNKYDHIKSYFKKTIIKDDDVNKSLKYMAASSSMVCLKYLIRMSIDAENICKTRLDKKDWQTIKVINAFPLRTSIVRKYIDLDSVILVCLLCNKTIKHDLTKTKREYYSDIKGTYREVWNAFFKLDSKVFRKAGFEFGNRISTDGIGCSILFKGHKRVNKNATNIGNYVNLLTDNEKKYICDNFTNFIGCDPGKSDLFYATNGNTTLQRKENGKEYRKTDTFRYSQAMRKMEMKTETYNNRIQILKEENKVIPVETKLSEYNSSSCKWSNVISYIKAKNAANSELFGFYKKPIHRTLKWYRWINKERSESNMLNRFKDKFGSPEDTVVLMGDWSENRPKKYQEPTKGKSLRKLFTGKGGYRLYLVNEFRTSCKLIETGEDLVKFRKSKSSGNYVHRLLGSKSLQLEREMNEVDLKLSRKNINGRPTIINRDLNGALNIRYKGLCYLKGEELPEYFTRTVKENPSTKRLDIEIPKDGSMKSKSDVKLIRVIKSAKKDGEIQKISYGIICRPSNGLGSKIKSKVSRVTVTKTRPHIQNRVCETIRAVSKN